MKLTKEKFSREYICAVSQSDAFSGSFDSAPISRVSESRSTRSAQDDSGRGNRFQSHSLYAPGASQRVAGRALHFWQLLLATLREIFDENAYERFLARTRAARSVSSYCEFQREREAAMVRRPRCC